jgi:cell division protein FtsN
MGNKKIILVFTSMTLAMSAPASPDRAPLVPATSTERTQSTPTTPKQQNLILAAENEKKGAEGKSQTATDKNARASGSVVETTENSVKNSNDSETKPLKPFVPSEKIPAEQAVDFPVDI